MGVDASPAITVVEVIFRFLALISLGSASLFIWYNIWKRTIRPRIVWSYVATVATVTALWRLVIIMFIFYPALREDWFAWITPITAAFYFLSGLSLFILAFCATRRRREIG
jgi:hypothetical protein